MTSRPEDIPVDVRLLYQFDAAAWLPLAAGAAAAGLPILAAWAVARRTPAPVPLVDRVRVDLERTDPTDPHRALLWLPAEAGTADRRRAVRRGGPPTPVRLAAGPEDPVPADGLVVDRSSGGLCVAADRPLSVGCDLLVRPAGAPEGGPWVAVTVRSCRPRAGYYLAGCAFRRTPPWATLLQFG